MLSNLFIIFNGLLIGFIGGVTAYSLTGHAGPYLSGFLLRAIAMLFGCWCGLVGLIYVIKALCHLPSLL